jgi:hypothetical protein
VLAGAEGALGVLSLAAGFFDSVEVESDELSFFSLFSLVPDSEAPELLDA